MFLGLDVKALKVLPDLGVEEVDGRQGVHLPLAHLKRHIVKVQYFFFDNRKVKRPEE